MKPKNRLYAYEVYEAGYATDPVPHRTTKKLIRAFSMGDALTQAKQKVEAEFDIASPRWVERKQCITHDNDMIGLTITITYPIKTTKKAWSELMFRKALDYKE